MSGPSLDDYIDVAERIATFTEKYPDGSLQTIDWDVRQVGDQTFIVYRAAAYRTPGDKRPGHGVAWEPFPGPTNFTRNSELMNAETAAWGRAIVAIGITQNRKIASKQEVRARQAEAKAGENGTPAAPTIDKASANSLASMIQETGWTKEEAQLQLAAAGAQDTTNVKAAIGRLTVPQAEMLRGVINRAIDAKVAA